jgi:hypothetical protein
MNATLRSVDFAYRRWFPVVRCEEMSPRDS